MLMQKICCTHSKSVGIIHEFGSHELMYRSCNEIKMCPCELSCTISIYSVVTYHKHLYSVHYVLGISLLLGTRDSTSFNSGPVP